jgi:CHAD domain-containing protein
MAADQAFHDIVGSAVGGMIANLAPTLRGDVEGLHQMRVSLRRLRAHLVLFKPLLRRDKAEWVNRHLRDLGRVLGEARDWDVLMLETLPGIAHKHPDDTWPYVLQQAGDARRSAARSLVELKLRTPEFTALVLSLAASFAEDDGGFLNGSKAVRRPIGRMASKLLDRLARRVRKRGKHVRKLDGLELHALRKSMKKLRYGIAALESLFGGKKLKKYLKVCESLQALLGKINDAAAAERLIAQTTKQTRPDLAEPASLLRAWARRRRERHRRRLGRAWTKFRAASPLWH